MRPSWRKSLANILVKPKSNPDSRLAVVGIGNELQGDDAAGVVITRRLKSVNTHANILILEGGMSPEAFTGPLRRFKPNQVLLIDVADFAVKPGTIMFAEMGDITGWTGNSHIMPPTVLAEFLMAELGCQVAMLAIQPSQMEFGTPISLPVRRAINRIIQHWRYIYC